MPSRRQHTNSHHGCIQCKARRVRCDQTQPQCTRCSKRNQNCTYRHLTSAYDPFGQSNNSKRAPVTSSQPLQQSSYSVAAGPHIGGSRLSSNDYELPPQSPEANSFSLISWSTPSDYPDVSRTTHRLIHHYATHLSLSITLSSSQSETLPLFHAAIARHYMAHPYVHHALLTFSALHIASLSRANTHSSTTSPDLVTALSHKSTAIETLRPAVDRVDSQTCEPALAASGLLTCCAFALPLVGAPFDPIDLLAQIVSLFQGSTALFRMGWRDPGALDKTTSLMVRRSVVIAFANEAPWPEAEQAVDHLIHAIAVLDCPNQGRKEVLMDSALKSKVALRRVAAAPGVYTVATMWLGMVLPAFITYIQARDPLALILLAYWAVGLKGVSHVWWTRGWAERTLQAVWQSIGEEYVHLLVWPATEVGVIL